MTPDEDRLVEARTLRDAARSVVRTDIATVKFALSERPMALRIRERVVAGVTEAVEDGAALANENRPVVALTFATLVAWLFRRRLVSLAQAGFAHAKQTVTRRRA